MRYIITNQHINFYVEHGYIEFEELLPEEDFINCREEFEKIIKNMDQKTIYLQGRDLWRRLDPFHKIAKNRNLASIVKQLIGKSRIRLAFDQMSTFVYSEKEPLSSFFSFKELACIVVLYFDSNVNSCTFINPNHEFVPKDKCSHIYLIGYAMNKTLYVLNKQDLNTNYLKKFGYAFGDFLKEEFHPIIS